MKNNIHPKFNNKTVVICGSCNETFTTGSVLDEIRVEICSNCHPFYTGKAKIVDTENLVKKFESRQNQIDKQSLKSKKEKKLKRSQKTSEIKASESVTLKDMLKQLA